MSNLVEMLQEKIAPALARIREIDAELSATKTKPKRAEILAEAKEKQIPEFVKYEKAVEALAKAYDNVCHALNYVPADEPAELKIERKALVTEQIRPAANFIATMDEAAAKELLDSISEFKTSTGIVRPRVDSITVMQREGNEFADVANFKNFTEAAKFAKVESADIVNAWLANNNVTDWKQITPEGNIPNVELPDCEYVFQISAKHRDN